jgi:hypothetical protein
MGRKISTKESERFRLVVRDKSSTWDVLSVAVNEANTSGSLVNKF